MAKSTKQTVNELINEISAEQKNLCVRKSDQGRISWGSFSRDPVKPACA